MFWNNGLQIGRIFDEEKKGEEYIIRHYIVTSDKQSIYMEVQTCSGCNFANDTRESKKCLLKLKTSNMFLVGEKTKNFTDKFEKNKTLVLPKTQYVDIFQIMEINQHLNLNPQYYQVMDSSINDHIENQALYVEDIDLPDLPYIWDNSIREDFFTSIDIIKGIIPLSLCKFINGKLKNYKKTKEILYNFWKISFNLIRDFWNERCSVYHEINIALGITKNVLKEQYGKEKCITTKKPPTDKKYNDTEGLVNYIRYGGKIIDYYNCCVP
ncbi:uncharacterized protein OCT59_002428 [Rhizophagus irregularis]|uniref:uncharacterized protein n=1 Tax=Rhizophagus irregularis TaxID=588596 RepID=UPI00332ACE8E|nr:hypothetical protein OCT59_002428 [Rhizophagus irregularis]